jgi:hypothetical protein
MSAALTVQDFVIPDIQQYAYTVLPVDCATKFASDSGYPSAFDEATVNASHEMIEAATDPTFGSAWVDLSTFDFDSPDQIATKGEAADICEPGEGAMPDDPVLLNDGTVVAPYWSNHDIACYPKAHEIYFGETGLPDMVPGKVAIAAIGTPVTLPQTLNVADGASEAWAFLTPIAGLSPGIRYVTSDPGSGGNIEVNAQVPDPCTTWPYSQDYLICDIAAYSQQDYLTVQANPVALQAEDSSLTGSDWEADGGLVDLSTDAVIPSGADRYRFSSWTGAVSDPLSPSTTTVMNGPQTVTANYSLQHLLTVNTSGLPSPNLTHVTLEGSALGTANDPNPLAAWVDDGASLATLNADGDVNGADGIQYFFQGFTPALPATLTAQLTTTAGYLTMAQIINAALASGGVFGPNAAGQAASLTSKFSIVQADIAAGTYATALGDTGGFINQVQAQAGKAITPATATTLQLDAAMTYHIALCLGASQLSVTQEANDYASYKTLVGSLGGMALPPC